MARPHLVSDFGSSVSMANTIGVPAELRFSSSAVNFHFMQNLIDTFRLSLSLFSLSLPPLCGCKRVCHSCALASVDLSPPTALYFGF